MVDMASIAATAAIVFNSFIFIPPDVVVSGRILAYAGRNRCDAPHTFRGAEFRMKLRPLDEFDLVAVGVLDEGDHGGAVLHGPRFPRDFPALGADRVACLG